MNIQLKSHTTTLFSGQFYSGEVSITNQSSSHTSYSVDLYFIARLEMKFIDGNVDSVVSASSLGSVKLAEIQNHRSGTFKLNFNIKLPELLPTFKFAGPFFSPISYVISKFKVEALALVRNRVIAKTDKINLRVIELPVRISSPVISEFDLAVNCRTRNFCLKNRQDKILTGKINIYLDDLISHGSLITGNYTIRNTSDQDFPCGYLKIVEMLLIYNELDVLKSERTVSRLKISSIPVGETCLKKQFRMRFEDNTECSFRGISVERRFYLKLCYKNSISEDPMIEIFPGFISSDPTTTSSDFQPFQELTMIPMS
jgi:hypothetical protein